MALPAPLRVVVSFTPASFVVWANQYFDLFRRLTVFANPDWQHFADSSAFPGAVLVSILISVVFVGMNKPTLWPRLRRAWITLVILLVICVAFFAFLSFSWPRPLSESLNLAWMIVYIFMLIFVAISVAVAALYASAKP